MLKNRKPVTQNGLGHFRHIHRSDFQHPLVGVQLKPFKKIIHIHLEAVGLFPGCFDVFFPLRSLNQVAVDSVQIADQGGERRPDVVGKAGHHLPVGLIALIELRDCIPIPLRNSVDFIKKGRHNIIRRCQHTAVQIAVSDIFKCLIHIPDAFACLIEFPYQNKSRAAGKEQKRCQQHFQSFHDHTSALKR